MDAVVGRNPVPTSEHFGCRIGALEGSQDATAAASQYYALTADGREETSSQQSRMGHGTRHGIHLACAERDATPPILSWDQEARVRGTGTQALPALRKMPARAAEVAKLRIKVNQPRRRRVPNTTIPTSNTPRRHKRAVCGIADGRKCTAPSSQAHLQHSITVGLNPQQSATMSPALPAWPALPAHGCPRMPHSTHPHLHPHSALSGKLTGPRAQNPHSRCALQKRTPGCEPGPDSQLIRYVRFVVASSKRVELSYGRLRSPAMNGSGKALRWMLLSRTHQRHRPQANTALERDNQLADIRTAGSTS